MLGTLTFETNRVCLCISQAKREQLDIAFACSIHSAYGACSSNGVAVYIYARICLFVSKLPQTIRHRCAWLMQTRIYKVCNRQLTNFQAHLVVCNCLNCYALLTTIAIEENKNL